MNRTLLLSVAIIASFTHEGTSRASADLDEAVDREALGRTIVHPYKELCPRGRDRFRCLAKVVTDERGGIVRQGTPYGWSPSQLQSAYKLPPSGGGGKLVAIIDVGDYPNAEADLAVYRSEYGLSACTTANGCFSKVDEHGGTNYPASSTCDNGSSENALDIQMVSAVCPDCRIMLVEPASYSTNDLGAAIDTAVAAGAVAISNSYGGDEWDGEADEEKIYDRPGVLITASSGDSGYGVQYPAASAFVLATGGTTLAKSSSSRGWAEQAWDGAGSGCSAYIAKPSWQTGTGCATRMVSDVSAVADPNTGVAMYCTDPGSKAAGWMVMGGTSVSSPLVAAMFTLLGVSRSPSYPWGHASSFFDVTTGSNGSCSTALFCHAEVGYDGPTGWGTPDGTLLAVGVDAGSVAPSDGGGAAVDASRDAADDARAADAMVADASAPLGPPDASSAPPEAGAPEHDAAQPVLPVDAGAGSTPVDASVRDSGIVWVTGDSGTEGAPPAGGPLAGGSSGCSVGGGGGGALSAFWVALLSASLAMRGGVRRMRRSRVVSGRR